MATETNITAATSKEQLPTDTSTLQEMVLTLLDQIDDLSGQLYYLKRQLFGKKSEKLHPAQRLLFENLYDEIKAKVEEEQQQPKTEPVKKTKKKSSNHKGRNPLPANLPRKTIDIEPSEEEKVCSVCHSPKQRIGTDTTEVLEYVPASFFVKQYARHKYGCKKCESDISIGHVNTPFFEQTGRHSQETWC